MGHSMDALEIAQFDVVVRICARDWSGAHFNGIPGTELALGADHPGRFGISKGRSVGHRPSGADICNSEVVDLEDIRLLLAILPYEFQHRAIGSDLRNS